MKNLIKYIVFVLPILTNGVVKSQTSVDSLHVYPNPLCSTGTIYFELNESDTITLEILNSAAQTIQTYLSETILPAGTYLIHFNGDTLAPGLYFAHLKYGTYMQKTKKIIKTCDVTSTENITNKELFYPNPTHQILNIPIEGLKKIVITHLNGEILQTINTSEMYISLSDFATGYYMISIWDTNSHLITHQKILLMY